MPKAKKIHLSTHETKKILRTFKTKMKPRKGKMKPTDLKLAEIITILLEKYFTRVEDAAKIFKLFGVNFDNDHMAFRAFDIRSLMSLFMSYGYELRYDDMKKKIPFNFTGKKLTAIWLKHPNHKMPRIFLSELRLPEMPIDIQKIAVYYLLGKPKNKTPKEINPEKFNYAKDVHDPIKTALKSGVKAIGNYLHNSLWPTPTHYHYKQVAESSEYLAWVLFNKYYLNHFTLFVNTLPQFSGEKEINNLIKTYQKWKKNTLKNPQKPTIEDKKKIITKHLEMQQEFLKIYESKMRRFNHHLSSNGFELTVSLKLTGKKKVKEDLNISPDKLLLQSSTKAADILGDFPDGKFKVPGSYVEFAYRGILPKFVPDLLERKLSFKTLKSIHLRDGFETANATNIFASTDRKQNIIQTKKIKKEPANPFFQATTKKIHAFEKEFSTLQKRKT